MEFRTTELIECSPARPEEMDWSNHYPAYFDAQSSSSSGKQVEWADVGCGFGGLLMALAPQFPETLMLGEPRYHVRPY